jgi:hypothetical protein
MENTVTTELVHGSPQNWSLEDVAAALRVAMDDLETFERAGADLLWGGSCDA